LKLKINKKHILYKNLDVNSFFVTDPDNFSRLMYKIDNYYAGIMYTDSNGGRLCMTPFTRVYKAKLY